MLSALLDTYKGNRSKVLEMVWEMMSILDDRDFAEKVAENIEIQRKVEAAQ